MRFCAKIVQIKCQTGSICRFVALNNMIGEEKLSTTEDQPLELARAVVSTLEDKKGEDILLMDIQNIASFADYFVLCSGTSDRMLDGLADAVMESAKKGFQVNASVEGQPIDGWLVVDLGDVVVHLFSPEQRDYYDIEKLWDRGKVLVRLV
jgi:ribosome-associated protein